MDVGWLGRLHTRLKSDVVRLSYVPKNELGMEEYVLVFEDSIPDETREKRLYNKATRIEKHKNETSLFFDNINTEVILLTKEGDDNFRREYPEIILKNEAFMIDKSGNNYEIRYTNAADSLDKLDVNIKVFCGNKE